MGINEIGLLVIIAAPFLYCMIVQEKIKSIHPNRAERRKRKKYENRNARRHF